MPNYQRVYAEGHSYFITIVTHERQDLLIKNNEKDFNLHLDYIHYNPVKHKYTNTASSWEYGSFQKYVKLGWYDEKWCDFEDDVSLGE